MQEQRLYEGILEHRDSGEVVVGDGSFLFSLEKRGYVKPGLWTPEAVAERPNAVEDLCECTVVKAASFRLKASFSVKPKDRLRRALLQPLVSLWVAAAADSWGPYNMA
ncbi:hypothetical protein CB1_000917026 [Camelus ferus]|nr:hypothetical protein CB1_000917026 [Camelus ferus]